MKMEQKKDSRPAVIKQRILQFVEYLNISKRSFVETIDISHSALSSAGLRSEVGGEAIITLLHTYPLLSAEWLLRGSGEMLREINTQTQPITIPPPVASLSPSDYALQRIEELARENGQLQAENKQLHMQLEQAQHSELPRQSIVRSQRAPSKKRMPI
jgi:hypothetical protein